MRCDSALLRGGAGHTSGATATRILLPFSQPVPAKRPAENQILGATFHESRANKTAFCIDPAREDTPTDAAASRSTLKWTRMRNERLGSSLFVYRD